MQLVPRRFNETQKNVRSSRISSSSLSISSLSSSQSNVCNKMISESIVYHKNFHFEYIHHYNIHLQRGSQTHIIYDCLVSFQLNCSTVQLFIFLIYNSISLIEPICFSLVFSSPIRRQDVSMWKLAIYLLELMCRI